MAELSIKSMKDQYTDATSDPNQKPKANPYALSGGPRVSGNNATNLGQVADEQTKAAGDFYNNLPTYGANQTNLAAEGSYSDLARQQAATQQGYNRRGLLYSGLNQNAQAQNQVGAANGLAQQVAQNNLGNQQNYQNMTDQALGNQAGLYNLQTSQNWLAYQQAMAEQQRKQQAAQGLLGGIASIGGAALGAI